jgi:hypothetical protein
MLGGKLGFYFQKLLKVSPGCILAARSMESRKLLNKKALGGDPRVSNWVQGLDLNQRPSGYEPAR